MNLIASKVAEQLYGFLRTHVALCAVRSAMWVASGKRCNDADGPIFPTPIGTKMLIALMKGPGDFALRRRWLALVVGLHHGVQPAWPETKIATVKWSNLIARRSSPDFSPVV